jgi:metallo-beta-lactamase class B
MAPLLAAALLLGAPFAAAQPPGDPVFSQTRIGWNQPVKPFRIIGNLYYVGMAGVSAFLITTPQGHILTDGGLPESAAPIAANIKALGFDIKDVKILLNSHAHFDHSGGLARLKAESGARFYASAADRPILESGHIGWGPAAQVDAPPVHVDRAFNEGDSFSLGGVTLTAHITPAHTPGCTTWTAKLADKDVMFFCSISVAGNPLVGNTGYPDIVAQYRAGFAKLEKMKADIFLAPHGDQFGMKDKLARVKPGAPNPFVDPGELPRFLAGQKAAFETELARQQAAAKKP